MRRVASVLVVLVASILVEGCGEKTLPDTPPGTSRAFMENPLGAAKQAKQAKESAKAKRDREIASKADPRGK